MPLSMNSRFCGQLFPTAYDNRESFRPDRPGFGLGALASESARMRLGIPDLLVCC